MIHSRLIALIMPSLLSASHATAQTPTISIAAPEYWCPYACSAQDELQGFAIEITRAAFKAVNIEVIYSNKPYDRALAEVKLGKIDGVVPTFKDEAPDFIYPQKSISSTQYCFYTLNSKWRYSGVDSIKGTEFGVTSGYAYSPEMDIFINNNKGQQVQVLHGEDIPKRMYQMVKNNRFHAFLEDTRLIDFLVETRSIGRDLKRSGCIDIINHGFLALSPANKVRSTYLSKQFDKGLLAISLKNIPKIILKKYGIKDHSK